MERIKDSFEQIHADPAMISSTKNKLAAMQKKEQRKRSPVRRSYWQVACACALIAIIISVKQLAFPAQAASYVSIDGIPSMELVLDEKEKVISVKPYNEMGEEALEELELKGLSYEKALETLLENETMQSFLKDEDTLVISFSSEDEETEALLEKKAGEVGLSHGCHFESSRAEQGLVKEAHEENMSFGKYQYYLMLKSYDTEIELEDCHHMSMAELQSSIKTHEEDHDSDHSCDEAEEEGHCDKENTDHHKKHK